MTRNYDHKQRPQHTTPNIMTFAQGEGDDFSPAKEAKRIETDKDLKQIDGDCLYPLDPASGRDN